MTSRSNSGGRSVMEAQASDHRTADCEVAIIGAGPYGLSTAAHLKAAGVDVRIFGKPMDFWATRMPAGMLLRSPRVASSLSDPKEAYSLEAYESANGVPARKPLPIETFVAYGQWFQNQLVPDLDTREVARVERTSDGFKTTLQDGTTLNSKRVVVAAGIGAFPRIPDVFRDIPNGLVSHCYAGVDVRASAGKKILVIGAGQSALECSALLSEGGADVELVARNGELRWIGQHQWLHNLGPVSSMLYSKPDVGPAGISRMVVWPNFLSKLPVKWRDKIRTRAVRPAGSPWLPARLTKVNKHIGHTVASAKAVGSRVEVRLDDGTMCTADQVLLGTGYTVDLKKYTFLSPQLLEQIRTFDGYPMMQPGFETSVPGLYMIGAPAARTFGPWFYFVVGAEYAAPQVARAIKRSKVAR